MLKSINLSGPLRGVISRWMLAAGLLSILGTMPLASALAQERASPAVEAAVKGAVETWLKGRLKSRASAGLQCPA